MLISWAIFSLSVFSAHASSDFQTSVRSLLSCAYDATINLDGTRFSYKWASPDRNSYFISSCTPLESERNQIVFFSPDSVSSISFKEPKPYKGGMEQPLYRIQLNQETYYLREDITGGMDSLFDRKGVSLYSNRDSIDVSAKNVVLNYFMQQMLGKTNASGSLVAQAISSGQEAFAIDCLVKDIQWLSKSLLIQFIGKAGKGTSPSELDQWQSQLTQIFTQTACSVDPSLRTSLDQALRVMELLTSNRIKVISKSNGLSFSTQYSGSVQDTEEYRRLTQALGI